MLTLKKLSKWKLVYIGRLIRKYTLKLIHIGVMFSHHHGINILGD